MYFKVPADVYNTVFGKILPEPAIVHRFEHLLPYTGNVRAPELLVYATPFADVLSIRLFNIHGHEEYLLPIPFDRSDLDAIKASTPLALHYTVTPGDYTQCALFAYLLEIHTFHLTGLSPYLIAMPLQQQETARRHMYDSVFQTIDAYKNYLESLGCGSHDYTNMVGCAQLVLPFNTLPTWRDVMVAA